METVSIRLDNIDAIDSIGKLLKENRSAMVRDLIEEGKKMKSIKLYKEKKVSMGLAAALAGINLSDFIDLLEEYNLPLNLTLDDAKAAMKHAERLI